MATPPVPTIVGTSRAASDTFITSTFTVPLPAYQDGDVLIAVASVLNNGSPTGLTPPAAYSRRNSGATGGNYFAVFTRTIPAGTGATAAGGTETWTVPTGTTGGSWNYNVSVVSVRNIVETPLVTSSATLTTTGAWSVGGPISSAATGGLVIIAGGGSSGSSAAGGTARQVTSVTAPNGFTSIGEDPSAHYQSAVLLYKVNGVGVAVSETATTITALNRPANSAFGMQLAFAHGNTAPDAPTITAPADQASVDRSTAQAITWTHSDPDGDPQAGYDVQARVSGTTTWTRLASAPTAGATASYTVPAGTLAGKVEVQVRTYDPSGAAGAWSTSRNITFADLTASSASTAASRLDPLALAAITGALRAQDTASSAASAAAAAGGTAASLTASAIGAAATTDVQVFTASGTWTMPAGARAVTVIAFGGGSGGGAITTGGVGSTVGGWSGARATGTFVAALLSATVPVTVGAGGNSVTVTNASSGGGSGGASSFGTYLTAGGGVYGQAGVPGTDRVKMINTGGQLTGGSTAGAVGQMGTLYGVGAEGASGTVNGVIPSSGMSNLGLGPGGGGGAYTSSATLSANWIAGVGGSALGLGTHSDGTTTAGTTPVVGGGTGASRSGSGIGGDGGNGAAGGTGTITATAGGIPGGGGGGAAVYTTTATAISGAGGRGEVIVITEF